MEGRISREFASFGIESAKLLFYPQNPVGQGEPCEDNSTIMLIVMFECFSTVGAQTWWVEDGVVVVVGGGRGSSRRGHLSLNKCNHLVHFVRKNQTLD